MGREEAVKHTVDTCIREGILRDFLLKYREEAIEMCIFEYDEEETLRQLGQQSYEGGVAAGIEQGREEGKLVGEEQRLFRQVCTKLKKGENAGGDRRRTGRRSFTNTIHLRGGRRICAGI